MYTLKFTLKQHTPIIHFQNDHSATIRCSELKPKLDRFIISKFSGWDSTPEKWKQKIDDPRNESLNYRIKVYPVGNQEKLVLEKRIQYPSFFANMGPNYEMNGKKTLNYYDRLLHFEIHSYNKDLFDWLLQNNILPEFFALNNFGTRQSKGFGSFTVKQINGLDCKFPTHLFRYKFNINFSDFNFTNFKLLFEKIDIFYRSLRSGLNLMQGNNKLYVKSLLFMYVHHVLNQQWDKKTIKKHFLNEEQTNQCDKYDDAIVCDATEQGDNLNNKDFRDLFGLSSNESWRGFFNLQKVEGMKENGKWIEKPSDDIDIKRFRSPMFFKIIRIRTGFKVYFTFLTDSNVLDRYTQTTFIIKNNKSENKSFPLPLYSGFDYFEFMDWVIAKTDMEDHIHHEGTNPNHIKYKQALIDIFNQLQN